MKQHKNIRTVIALVSLCLVTMQQASAQGYDTPLTFQGLNRTTLQSAASRAAGGVTVGMNNDVALMFTNPALLNSVRGIQFSLGSVQQYTYAKQEQRYGGLQGFSAFHLLMQGLTGEISDPDTIQIDQTDSVQRPFDTIGPNWNASRSNDLPVQAFAAIPFSLGEYRVVAGVGVAEYANLDRYYQNNNSLSPAVLSVLDSTIRTGNLNANPYKVQWYQYYQQRAGSIFGYGAAFSIAFSEKFSLGLSGMLLSGNTDDKEVRVGRGRMLFFTNSLRLDKQDMSSYSKTGTSDYSGAEFTLSGRYSGKNFHFGFTLKPPATITRKFSSQMLKDSVIAVSQMSSRVDSLHLQTTASESGEDEMQLPWRGTFGLAITVRENLKLGLEYEFRPYSSATYTAANGTETNPWLSASIWRLGVEYLANEWLTLRGGVRGEAEVFEPLSNALRGEAVSYSVYSLGCGLKFTSTRVNIAYEYSDMKFIDTWSNAASINREFRNTIVADVSYELPW